MFHHPIDETLSTVEPLVNYVLRIDTADRSSLFVEMNVQNVPVTFRLAMAAYPEYDDRYWHFVKGMHVMGMNGEKRSKEKTVMNDFVVDPLSAIGVDFIDSINSFTSPTYAYRSSHFEII